MLNTVLVGRFIYVQYLEYFMLNTGKIYLHKTLGNTGNTYVEHCWKIYLHKILGILYVEHCGKIYLHKILGNTLC